MGDLQVYGMTDQPTTCPKCGCRTEFDEIPGTEPLRETHICNNPDCKFKFIVEDGD